MQPAPFLRHPESKLAQVARQPSGALWGLPRDRLQSWEEEEGVLLFQPPDTIPSTNGSASAPGAS